MNSKSSSTESEGPRKAVALRYDQDSSAAPRLVASGLGEIAEQILATASENGVPVEVDSDLVELLAVCELEAEIPIELYSAVAELLSWLYSVNGSLAA